MVETMDRWVAVTLGRADVPEVVSVLSEAFFDYPLMRFVLGAGPDYEVHLDRLISFFVMARLLRDDVLLGVHAPAGLEAVALASYPGSTAVPAELSVIREETWAELGASARARYESFAAAARSVGLEVPNVHLNMLGVRHAAQGQGLSETLLDAVHELSVVTPASTGVTVRTEQESSVPAYTSYGYQVVGSADIESAITTWGLYRRDR